MRDIIPKKIHYCWFGKGEKKELILKCIESWKKLLPDYEIIEWNEENFDVNSNQYTQKAYENKMWAFVSDYVRLYVLYNYGGIYFDTDIEVIKNMDTFLKYPVFLGFHAHNVILTAVMGAKIKNEFIKTLFEEYNNKYFIKNGKFDITTNNELLTDICVNKFNLELNNKNQILNNTIYVFDDKYFDNNKCKEKNYTIHHGDGSWYSGEKILNELKSYKAYYFCMLKLMNKVLDKKKLKKDIIGKRIAVYGNGEVGHLLIKILNNNNIEPMCIIDKNINFISYEGIPIIQIEDIHNYNIDYIVITPIAHLESITKELDLVNSGNIISIEEIYEGYDKR